MISDHVDELLDRLNAGDRTAAQQVFLLYEPYLRAVVRRRLPDRMRTKFDSTDVVLSAWVDIWDGFRQGEMEFHRPEATARVFVTVHRQLLHLHDHDRRQRPGHARAVDIRPVPNRHCR